MKRLYTCLMILFCTCLFLESSAQYNPKNVCRIEDNRTIFRLDRRWTDKQRKEVENLFDLDSLLLAAAFRGSRELVLDGAKWEIKNLDKNVVEISKDLNITPTPHVNTKDIFIFEDLNTKLTNIKTQQSVIFGINSFKLKGTIAYNNEIARFYLAGQSDARKVYLAGTFNNWNTTNLPMRQTPNGWIASIKLKPGKYLYKYIIDGKWKEDPNNYQKEDDLNGGKNSVVFCPNFQFELKNHLEVHSVILAGSFNNWQTNQLSMTKTAQGWTLPVYLKDGTYSYKFIVDGNWITDPANKNMHADVDGNMNSYLGIGNPIVFQLKGFTTAKHVVLTGNFNNWDTNELPMEKSSQGWKISYIIAPGNYEYKFLVDGNWITDPANLILVGQGNYRNSFVAFKPNHTFKLDKYPNAKKVYISGDFCNWSNDEYPMVVKDGVWQFPLYLSPGKHTYKFVVDGKWILDPDNRLWEANQYSTNNSVVWIEP